MDKKHRGLTGISIRPRYCVTERSGYCQHEITHLECSNDTNENARVRAWVPLDLGQDHDLGNREGLEDGNGAAPRDGQENNVESSRSRV